MRGATRIPDCPHGLRPYRCRPCTTAYKLAWARRRGVQEPGPVRRAILAALADAPAGLTAERLRARLGYRQSVASIVSCVSLAIRRGAPLERRRGGGRTRYVLRREVA